MFIGYLTGWVRFTAYDSFGPQSKFEILLLKIFSLKQKTKSNTSSYHRKNQSFTFQENFSLDKGLQ